MLKICVLFKKLKNFKGKQHENSGLEFAYIMNSLNDEGISIDVLRRKSDNSSS